MNKIAKSFRLSKNACDQLEIMTKIERQQAENLGITPPSSTELLERSIETLYTMMTDEAAGDNYLTRMTNQIRDAVNQGLSLHDQTNNNLMYELLIMKEMLITQFKLGRDYPKSNEIIHDVVFNKKTPFQEMIEEKIYESIK